MTIITEVAATDRENAELHFAAGIPGFPSAKSFSVKPWGTEPTPFYVLECHDVAGLRFVAVRPVVFFPWYEPRFGAEVYQAVDAGGLADVLVLVILTLHATAGEEHGQPARPARRQRRHGPGRAGRPVRLGLLSGHPGREPALEGRSYGLRAGHLGGRVPERPLHV